MATCNPQALLDSANCFDCLTDTQLEQVQVQMLCDLVNEGLAGGPFVPIANINGTDNYIAKFSGPNSLENSVAYELTGLIGLNTITPVTELHVVSTSASDPRGIMTSQHSGDTAAARLHFRKSRGTPTVPVVITSGDMLGRLRFSGYDGSNYIQMASIDVVSTGTIAVNRVPTYMAFSTATDAAPSVLTERVRILSSGKVGVGTSTPSSSFQVGTPTGAGVSNLVLAAASFIGADNLYGGIVSVYTANAAAVGMGGQLNFGGESGNAFSPYPFAAIKGSKSSAVAGEYSGQLQFYATDVGGTPRIYVTIREDGNTGIGTTAPKSKLDIVGNLTVGATYGGVNAAPTSGAIIEGPVGIGTNAPDADAILDLVSTTKAFLPPRMTEVQRDAIPTPTAGMVVYNSTTNLLNFYNGGAWGAV